MLQIKQSLVCVCMGTGGALKWSDLLMFYWNSVMEEESFISVSFFPLSWFRPRCVQEALLGYTGWKDCKSRMNVWVFSLTKYIFVYDILQQLRKKSHLQQCDIQIDTLSLLQELFLMKMQKILSISVISSDHSRPVLGSRLPVSFLWNP